jgi:hypothetical protein
MPIYFSFHKIPELASRTKADRKAAVKRIAGMAIGHWEWWLGLAVAGVLTAAGAWFGGRGVSGVVGAGVGAGVGSLFHQFAVVHIARKYYSAILRE